MGRVLVLNARARHSLVAIRSLGRRGCRVTAGSETGLNAGSHSKYVSRRLRYPSPVSETEAFLRALERELTVRDYEMLLPINQQTVEIVTRHRDRFEPHTVVPFPPNEILDYGLDKSKTIQAARDANVPHPGSVLEEPTDFDGAAAKLGFPIVVKPHEGSDRSGVTVCESPDELVRACRETTAEYGHVMLQEFIPRGDERGVYTLYDDAGELVHVTVQRRLRSLPPEGGASTYRETISDPELVETADRLLSSIGWRSGVAMVEFRIDARTGEPKLMEINPRLWGSLALSVSAGVDFPYDLYRQATGHPVDHNLDYEVGVQARDALRDVVQALYRDDTLTALAELVQPSEAPCSFDVLSWDDPLPTLGHLLYYSRHALRRLHEERPAADVRSADVGRTAAVEVNK